ncbi:ATP-binding cassette domain-containing protein [Cellulomonas hominis]
MSAVPVIVEGISKSFGLHQVLDDVTLRLDDGEPYCLMGRSGAGKTTLLRILCRLEHPDRGRLVGLPPGAVSMLFQDDRLCEVLTPVENVALVHPDRRTSRAAIRRSLEEILPARSLDQPVVELSGGMRRRVSLACALAYPGRLIALDEPFTGLDGDTKRTVIRYLERHRRGRTLLATTHSDEDASLLGATRITLPTAAGAR